MSDTQRLKCRTGNHVIEGGSVTIGRETYCQKTRGRGNETKVWQACVHGDFKMGQKTLNLAGGCHSNSTRVARCIQVRVQVGGALEKKIKTDGRSSDWTTYAMNHRIGHTVSAHNKCEHPHCS